MQSFNYPSLYKLLPCIQGLSSVPPHASKTHVSQTPTEGLKSSTAKHTHGEREIVCPHKDVLGGLAALSVITHGGDDHLNAHQYTNYYKGADMRARNFEIITPNRVHTALDFIFYTHEN